VATTATDNGGSGVDGAAAPVVLGGGGDVGEMRRSVARSRVVSAMVEDDGGEWDELGGAPGALQLRRRAVMLGAEASVVPGRPNLVKKVGNGEGSAWMERGFEVLLTGGECGGEPRRRRRDANGDGVRCGGFGA